MGERFLGLGYDPAADEIIMKVVPFIRMKVKRSRQRRADHEPITQELLEDLRTGERALSKRRVLAFLMAQYDPLGMLSPLEAHRCLQPPSATGQLSLSQACGLAGTLR